MMHITRIISAAPCHRARPGEAKLGKANIRRRQWSGAGELQRHCNCRPPIGQRTSWRTLPTVKVQASQPSTVASGPNLRFPLRFDSHSAPCSHENGHFVSICSATLLAGELLRRQLLLQRVRASTDTPDWCAATIACGNVASLIININRHCCGNL